MSYIEWSDSLSVGYEELDAQHKKMLEIINELFNAVAQGGAWASMALVGMELMEYAQSHFEDEEALMRSCGYPGLAEHQQEHIRFMERIRDFMLVLEEGHSSGMLPMEMFHFLQSWLTEHIMRLDKDYGVYCKAHEGAV
ncbi:bacteriohemerythrin [Desulfovibrio mangrovi]|uniref:bacteriohemerythrin n=1 Tax=Desulfovibrio mangrovi TaxID=2976983 RepID=UPI002247FF7B|nr:bacteriohemerythrin [Desulfovibrio mangrovi]UZP66493.1 bacteriohemerythrin [Desulfovibrio mangrovi]